MPTLAEILKFNRVEIHQWTLQEAADLLGTSKSHIHNLESGVNKNPRLNMVAKLCAVYRIAPEQILRCANVTVIAKAQGVV